MLPAANWTGAPGSPAGDPTDPEDLVFPAGVNAALRTARNDIANGVFNSISFGDGGYVLIGNPLTLGEAGVLGSGFIVANAGPTTATDNIQLNITLGVSTLANPVPSVQTFTVQSTADLTISGRLNGIGVSTLTKDGPGTLTLAGNNTGLAGPVKVADNAGALIVTNANALGSSAAPTTVGVNASLALGSGGAGLTYNEPLILNGPGTTGLGALWNLGGTNTWAGTISLDSNSSIGARTGSTLIVTGVISDTAGGRDLTKSDQGEVRFDSPTGNTYRGLTTIEDGVLSIGHPLALGAPNVLGNNDVPSVANGTVVKSTLTGQGQLRVGDAFGSGFTVRDEFLTLNGAGRDGRGSLFNQAGDNQWAGPITLGSSTNTNATSVTVGAVTGSNLLVSGIVHDRPTNPPTVLPFPLIKGAAAPTGSPTEQGRVILNNNNAGGTFATSYAGGTTVNQGFLTARDSGALGTGSVLVNTGASLELEVEFPLGNSASPNAPRFDPHGRDLWADSVTNDPNRLAVANNITINGPGQGTTNTGALHSISGINVTTGTLKVFNSASVGVDLDSRAGAPSQDRGYFTNDYSLTVNVLINEPPPLAGVGPIQANLTKRGAGQLILPNANTGFYSQTLIEQGWVTIRNNRSLGATDNVTDVLNPVNNTNEPVVTVSNGAALHLLPFPNQNLTIAQYISLTGNGTASPAYAFIKQKGALLSLDGNNLWTGDITLNGDAGIGVEETQAYAGAFSELTVGPGNGTGPGTGTVQDGATKGGLTKFGSKRLVLQGDGTYSGNNLIKEGTLRAQNDTALGQATSGTFTTQESYNQTDTNVAAGAVLELATSLPRLNGGIATGLEVWAERLILNAPAQQVAIAGLASAGGTFALTYASDTTGNTETSGPLPLTTNAAQLAAVLNDATRFPNLLAQVGSVSVSQIGNVFTVRYGTARTADVKLANLVWSATTGAEVTAAGGNAGITTLSNTTAATPVYSPTANMADDHTWRGPVTLADSARVNVAGGTRLALLGAIDDATNLNPLGSDLIKRGPSELVLGGSSTFRGQTRIDTGIVTAVNGGAFGAGGSAPGGTFVQPGAQVQLQGTVTVAGEYLDVQGAGWVQNQVLDLGGTGGTFTLSLLGKTTAAMPYNATAAQVQAALNAAPFNTVIATPPEIQTVQVTGTAGTFTLSYPGAGTTAALNVGSTAAAVQAALNTAGVLPAGATATVSSVTLGLTPFQRAYSALFDSVGELLSGEVLVQIGTDTSSIPFTA
ncbi:MAG: autotransporter-associated beta strand repeat-containing protein, partial [Gemmataceae bacterium]|nr:autotransporter-associated beta strand repeat-containing protein [Gemmataceae bacterium]